jgi:taurine transport system permease protein
MQTRQSNQKYLISAITLAVIMLAWSLLTYTHSVSQLILPTPTAIWTAFAQLVVHGYKGTSLWGHMWASLQRLFIAYFFALITAIPIGLLSGYSTKIRAVFEPIVAFIRPLPPLGYYTLIILWMGTGNPSKIFLLYLGAFAPIFVSCVSGVSRINPDYLNHARTLGASQGQIFVHVILPASLPEVFVGLRNAMSIAYATSVAAEMVAAVSGIGWLVLDASDYLRSDVVLVGIILMGVTGIILDKILLLIERQVVGRRSRA